MDSVVDGVVGFRDDPSKLNLELLGSGESTSAGDPLLAAAGSTRMFRGDFFKPTQSCTQNLSERSLLRNHQQLEEQQHHHQQQQTVSMLRVPHLERGAFLVEKEEQLLASVGAEPCHGPPDTRLCPNGYASEILQYLEMRTTTTINANQPSLPVLTPPSSPRNSKRRSLQYYVDYLQDPTETPLNQVPRRDHHDGLRHLNSPDSSLSQLLCDSDSDSTESTQSARSSAEASPSCSHAGSFGIKCPQLTYIEDHRYAQSCADQQAFSDTGEHTDGSSTGDEKGHIHRKPTRKPMIAGPKIPSGNGCVSTVSSLSPLIRMAGWRPTGANASGPRSAGNGRDGRASGLGPGGGRRGVVSQRETGGYRGGRASAVGSRSEGASKRGAGGGMGGVVSHRGASGTKGGGTSKRKAGGGRSEGASQRGTGGSRGDGAGGSRGGRAWQREAGGSRAGRASQSGTGGSSSSESSQRGAAGSRTGGASERGAGDSMDIELRLKGKRETEMLNRLRQKQLFENLRREIPSLMHKKRASKVKILHEATALCRQLTREYEENVKRAKQNKE